MTDKDDNGMGGTRTRRTRTTKTDATNLGEAPKGQGKERKTIEDKTGAGRGKGKGKRRGRETKRRLTQRKSRSAKRTHSGS